MTFTLNIKTAEDITAEAEALRAKSSKAECRARILDAVDEAEQANIAQAGVLYAAMRADGVAAAEARAAVGFAEGDLATAGAWKGWVAAMQAECRRAIADGDDPVWPALPDGVAELAARF